MKKMVVTGASSFIGQKLLSIVRKDWEVTAVIRKGGSERCLPEGLRVLRADMSDYDHLGELAGSCDCFVHLAWNGTRGASRMDAGLQQANLEYSLQGVRSMLEAGCGRIITAGSQAEYGPHAEQITEETPCIPNTEYGKAKLEFHRQASALCAESGILCMEPRFFSLYGPGDHPGTMIISILKDMLAGRPCKLTQGVQMWDFLHIDDAVRALTALCGEDCPGGVYNFGSGDTRPLRAYVEEMAAITQTKSELLFGAVPYPETGMVSLWPDVSKLKHELGWEPLLTFGEGIRTVLDSMGENDETAK